MLKKLFFIASTLLAPSISFAFFCPNNFNQIEIGDSIQTVTKQCGKPDKEETTTVTKEGPQEWSYYIPQTVSTTAMSQEQGTLKTQITFDENNKAINISVNGIGVGSSTICGTPINLGDSRDTVKSACGKPSFINKQQPATGQPPDETKITEFTYNSNPPGKLIFENGKLKEKQ